MSEKIDNEIIKENAIDKSDISGFMNNFDLDKMIATSGKKAVLKS